MGAAGERYDGGGNIHRARRLSRDGNHQTTPSGKHSWNYKVLPRPAFYGSGSGAELLERRTTGVLEEARCWAEDRDRKLQSNGTHVGEAEVARNLQSFTSGKRKRT